MKKILNIFIVFFVVTVVLTGCKKDEKTPVLNTKATVNPAWVSSPMPDTHFILVADSADKVLTTLEWSDVVYPLTDIPSALYSLQLYLADTVGETVTWREPVDLFTFPETTRTVTYAELNTAIVKIIGKTFAADTIITAGFRIKANVNANSVSSIIDAYTEIAQFTVTPYSSDIAAASLWVPGAYQGWDPAGAPQIWDPEGDGIYEGFVYFPETDPFDGNFKFTGNPNWDGPNYGDGGATGVLSIDPGAGNLQVPAFGGYWFTVDVNALTWTFESQNWGVIGSGILTGNWSADVKMVAVAAPFNVIETTIDVTEPQDGGALRFKFRMNDAWTLNYGADAGSNELISSGPDILMPDGPGNYTFKMNMSQPVFTYELIKN